MSRTRFANPKPPMLVLRTLHNTSMELREWTAVDAFAKGYATVSHFDLLVYLMNLLLVAGNSDRSRQYAFDFAEQKLKPTLAGIKARYESTQKLGVDPPQLKVLRQAVEFSKQFWLRQPGELFIAACAEVDAFQSELARGAST